MVISYGSNSPQTCELMKYPGFLLGGYLQDFEIKNAASRMIPTATDLAYLQSRNAETSNSNEHPEFAQWAGSRRQRGVSGSHFHVECRLSININNLALRAALDHVARGAKSRNLRMPVPCLPACAVRYERGGPTRELLCIKPFLRVASLPMSWPGS